MIIRCPNCQFEREVPLSAIPHTAVMATCPRCKTRFQFRNTASMPHESAAEESGSLQQNVPAQAAELHHQNDELRQENADYSAESGVKSLADSVVHAESEDDSLGREEHLSDEGRPVRQDRGLLRAEPGDDPLPPGAIVNSSAMESVDLRSAEQKARDENEAEAELFQTAEDAEEKAESISDSAEEEVESGEHNGSKVSVTPRLRGTPGKISESLADDVPWEKQRTYGQINSFYQTLLRVMFHPVDFFLAVPKCRGRLTLPAAFYIILGMIQTIAQLFWIHVKIFPAMTDPNVQALWSSTATTFSISLTIILKIFILPVELYIYAALFFLMLRLVQPEKADFAVVLRVIAYSSAPLIVYAVPVIGPLVGAIWFAGCCFVGCRIALGLPWIKVAMALGPLYLIAFAIMAQLCQHFGIL